MPYTKPANKSSVSGKRKSVSGKRKYTKSKKVQNKNNTPDMSLTSEHDVTLNEISSNEEINTIDSNPTTNTTKKNPAQKRLRETIQNSLIGNATKSPRLSTTESPSSSLNLLDKRFDKLTQEIQIMINNKFNEYKTELLNVFEKSFNVIKNELHDVTERVKQLETVSANIKSSKDEINLLKNKIKQLENKNVSCELRINEIPYNENENLFLIFEKICNTINISMPAIKTIYRLQNVNNKNKNNSKDAVIIVKMWSPYDKNYFLKSFTNFRKINKGFNFCLKHIGESSNNKFYINENLTQYNFNILRAANKLKKAHRIHSAFSLRGLIYVKIAADSNLIRIDEIEVLNDLFRDYEPEPEHAADEPLLL